MRGLNLYEFFTGSFNNFAEQFGDNQVLYEQARIYWNHLEGISLFLILIFILFGVLFAAYYYGPYNDKPGRHYKPFYWCIFGGLSFAFVFLTTFSVEYFFVSPKPSGSFMIEFKISILNAIYTFIVYVITSLIWCKWGKTNAYRIV